MPAGSPPKYGPPLSSPTAPIFSILFVLLVFLSPVLAIPRNVTIDDQGGDMETGKLPVYQPPDAWANEKCPTCAIRPDVNQLHNNTATAATFQSNHPYTIDFDFNGTAIYVFFSLFSNEGPGITVNTDCTFFIDDKNVGTFHHAGDSTKQRGAGRQYGALAFDQTQGLTPKQHHMRISMSKADANSNIFLSFDKAVYTTDPDTNSFSSTTPPSLTVTDTAEPDTTSPPEKSSSVPLGVIAGGVIGGVAILAGFVALVYYYRKDRRRHRIPKTPKAPKPHIPRPFIDPSLKLEEGVRGSSSRAAQPPKPGTITAFPYSLASSGSGSSESHSRSGSGSNNGSVEHQIRIAHKRMRSLRAEMTSNSGHTAVSSQSSSSGTASSAVTAELAEEVKKLKQEIQVLKRLQRQQSQGRQRQQPPFEPRPPSYTAGSGSLQGQR